MRSVKRNRIGLYILSLSFLALACSPEKRDSKEEEIPESEKEKQELFEQARKVHDDVMPFIDSIFTSKGRVQEELDRIREGIEEVGETRREALEEIAEELDLARESMMQWMREHGRMPSDTISNEELLKKLHESLEEIEGVQENILNSLKKADQLLKDSSGIE